MKIETKYNLGDKVWAVIRVRGYYEAVKFKIAYIEYTLNTEHTSIWYGGNNDDYVFQDKDVFETKEQAQMFAYKENQKTYLCLSKI